MDHKKSSSSCNHKNHNQQTNTSSQKSKQSKFIKCFIQNLSIFFIHIFIVFLSNSYIFNSKLFIAGSSWGRDSGARDLDLSPEPNYDKHPSNNDILVNNPYLRFFQKLHSQNISLFLKKRDITD